MKKLLTFFLTFALCVCALPIVSAEGTEGSSGVEKVACVGDSLTQGTCCSDEATCAYPAELQGLLDGDRYQVQNFGASGFAAMKNYDRGWSYWDHANFNKSHDFQPDIVILMLGTNDIIHAKFDTDYETDMTALIDSYKTLESQPTIYLVTAPVSHDSRGDNLQNKLIPAQKRIAENTGCTLIDLNTETASWDKNTLYAPDGLHFNDAGYRKIAEFFYEKIFSGEMHTLSVTAKEGISVTLAGQKGPTILTGDGKKTIRVSNGTTEISFDITVKGDTLLDLGDTTLEPGSSFSPSVTYVEKDSVSSETNSTPSGEGDNEEKSSLWIALLILGDILAVVVVVVVILFMKKKKETK